MQKDQFTGKIVAVTGSARGIGKNIAYSFGKEGAIVAICDIDRDKGKATEAELSKQGISAEFLYVDLSKKGEPQGMVQQIAEKWGRLDILVNNARSGHRTSLMEEDEDTWEEGMSVMLRAAFFASQEAIRVMSKMNGGCIVNISSISGLVISSQSPVYHAAKAAMLHMTRYLAVHAGACGVRVNAVLPGFIVQDEHRVRYERDDNQRYREVAEFSHPMREVGTSEDVANAVLFLCSPKTRLISGQCLVLDGGLTLQEQSGLIFQFEKQYVESN